MKTFFKYLVLTAVAVVALDSCNKEIDNPVVPEEKTINITVKASANDLLGEENTKTYIDNRTILWGTGEYMKLALTAGENTEIVNSTDASADIFDGDEEALFEFSVTDPGSVSSFVYQGLYPASAAVASNNTTLTNYKVKLPDIQNATSSSYDPAAYIMIAKPESFNTLQTDWAASFRRATALNKVTLKNVPSGVFIKRVKITAPSGKYLAGARHFDLTSGESGDIYNGGGRTETIEVKYSTPLTGANVDVWFTSWDVEVEAGETLEIIAYTTNQKSYTKTINVPAGKSIKFQEGCLNTMGANMENSTLADATELEEGNYLVLAKDGDSYYALKAETVSNDSRMASVDYSGSISSYAGDADMIWAVSKSGNSYILENSGKYLGFKGSDNKAFWESASSEWTETNYLLDITWNASNSCYNVTLNSNSARKLSRMSGNDWFAFYTSDQQKNLIFVPASVDSRTSVTLTFAESEINKTTANFSEFTGQAVTVVPNESVITSNITYAMTGDAIGTISGSTVTLNGTVGAATVTASFAGNGTYRAAEASYTITVNNASVVNLSFPFTSAISGWPAVSGDSSAGSYTYNLGGTDYTFTHTKSGNGIYCQTSYLMICSGNYLGLPAIEGYKLTSVSATLNGGGNPSTAAIGKITANTSGSIVVVSGGDEQTFDTKGGSKTFTLTGTEENTVYYLAISNKNFQCTQLDLVYNQVVSLPNPNMNWSASAATATYTTGNNLDFTAPTLNQGDAASVSYASSDETIATISAAGVVTVNLTDNVVKEGSTTISATCNDGTHKAQTVSYNLTVVDNREAVATPVILPDATDTVPSGTEVTITCATNGASIHYTLDNSTPDGSSTVYSGAITLTASKTVKAIAVKNGYKDSAEASATYTVGVVNTSTEDNPYSAADAASLAAQLGQGTLENVYVSGIISAISTEWNSQYNNVSFDISADGLTTSTQFRIFRASANSADVYKIGDAVEFKGTLKLYTSGNTSTPELDAAPTLIWHVVAPSFSPDGGSFTANSQSVTISADNGATIHYTLDGTTPDNNSAVYSSAITLTATTTIKAIAILNGHVTGVVSKKFTKEAGSYSWQETALSAITADDVFVIVGNNGSNYAMSNDKGTTNPPSAVSVTISDGKITSTVNDNIKWNLTVSNGNYTFFPDGSTDTWLYVYNNNNGLRVGTGTDKIFTINSNYLYNEGQERYIGIYNSANWRSYTSINNNITGQTFKFYVYKADN